MKIENEALRLQVNYNTFTEEAANIYKNLNKKEFGNFTTYDCFKPCLDEIFKAHKQFPTVTYIKSPKYQPTASTDKRVLLCCSGGLDSVYQALYLRDQGYEVILMHLQNANMYTNGKEAQAFSDFVDAFNFKYYLPVISPKLTRDNEFKKQWQENSFKNGLIYSIALDAMIANGIHYLSGGDDLRLTVDKSVTGVNTGDCREITYAFMLGLGINFIPVKAEVNKAMRLAYLTDKNARDYFYSTTMPGRLVESLHKKYSERFGVKLDKWNACTDRKDCMHILLDHYYNNVVIPTELEARCWQILGAKDSADNIFFDKSIPLEKRIKNLIEY